MTTILHNKAEFLDISIEEMNNSIAIAEAILRSFSSTGRCHWALPSMLDRILEMQLTLSIAKRLRLEIVANPCVRKEFHNYRLLAIQAMDNYPTSSKDNRIDMKNKFFTLQNCPESIAAIIKHSFTIEDGQWTFYKSKRKITNTYFSRQLTTTEDEPLVVKDFRQLLRIIIRVQNCLTFIYPKEIKEVRDCPLSNIGELFKSVDRAILALPKILKVINMVTDGTSFDLYTHNTKRDTYAWTSALNGTTTIGRKELRVYSIHFKENTIVHKEIFEIGDVLRTLPRHSSFKECELEAQKAKEEREVANDLVEAQLKELFARLG